jgi:hypothetical protein
MEGLKERLDNRDKTINDLKMLIEENSIKVDLLTNSIDTMKDLLQRQLAFLHNELLNPSKNVEEVLPATVSKPITKTLTRVSSINKIPIKKVVPTSSC